MDYFSFTVAGHFLLLSVIGQSDRKSHPKLTSLVELEVDMLRQINRSMLSKYLSVSLFRKSNFKLGHKKVLALKLHQTRIWF